MSRFYDVLKNASQSVQTPREGMEGLEPESFHDNDVAEMLANFQEPAANRAAVSSEPAPAKPDYSSVMADAYLSGKAQNAQTLVEEIEPPATPTSRPRPAAQIAPLGIVVPTRLKARDRLIPNVVGSMSTEHYRLLRTQIFQKQAEKMFRTLLVTSPNPQEGKTLTVLNVALTFAMLPAFKVLVVDGDIRKGSLGEVLGVSGKPGFTDLIQGSARLEEVVLRSDDLPISFVLRGTSKLSAPELLHSPNLRSHLQEMTKHFDIVLMDSPPTNLVTDAQLLASVCDAVLLVARAFSTPQNSLTKAKDRLHGSNVIGTVLNGRSENLPGYGYNSYYQGREK